MRGGRKVYPERWKLPALAVE